MLSPTVRSRRLRALLRGLREERGLTIEHVARQADWTAPKLSRIETGMRRAHPNDVQALATIYQVPARERQALITLACEARQRGWWHGYSNALPPWFETYVGLESEASGIAAYSAELIPDLLQTEDYTRALLRAAPTPHSDKQIDQRIHVQLIRQARLTGPNPAKLQVILNEAVLHRRVGGSAVMRAQFHRLIELARTATVTLRVLPFSTGAHPGTHGAFTVLTFPEPADPDVVYVEYLTGGAYLEAPEQLEQYALVLDHLRAQALDAGQSVTAIRRSLKSLL